MKWLRCLHEGTERWAILDGDEARIVDGAPGGDFVPTGHRVPADAIAWRPLPRPSKILALWNNFGAAAAKNGWSRPAEPLWFLKAPSSLAGHGETIPVPGGDIGRTPGHGQRRRHDLRWGREGLDPR